MQPFGLPVRKVEVEKEQGEEGFFLAFSRLASRPLLVFNTGRPAKKRTVACGVGYYRYVLDQLM